MFFENVWYFRIFKFCILATNNAIQFFHRTLFIYWTFFSIILSFFSYLLGENKFIESNKLLALNIKSINPIQKYLHITESYAYVLKMFVIIFLFPMNFLISFGICSAPKISKYIVITIHI